MLTRSHRNWVAPFMGDPFFGDLRRQMDRMLGDFDPIPGAFVPRFELSDTGDALRLRAELPGLSKDDLEVELERSTLSIRGRRETKAPEGYAVHRRERGAMEIARAFTLPCRIDPERATATLENGILELTLPKLAEEQPRRIEITVR